MKYLLCFILGVVATVSISSFAKVEDAKAIMPPPPYQYQSVVINPNGPPAMLASRVQNAANSAGNSGYYLKQTINTFVMSSGPHPVREDVLVLIFEKKN